MRGYGVQMKKVGKLKLKRMEQKRREIMDKVTAVATMIATFVIVGVLCNAATNIKNIEKTAEVKLEPAEIITSAGAIKSINTEVVNLSVVNNDKNIVTQTQNTNNNASAEAEEKPYKIRTTGYCDHGYMKGGKWVYDGAIAGKEEWLGRKCNLYRVNKDGSMGELIGTYTFEDTGYGIKTETPNGIEGSLKLGLSVDIWFPTEDAIWDFVGEYGDYTYIEWLD